MNILIQHDPRSIALRGSGANPYCLIFRHASREEDKKNRCVVEFLPWKDVNERGEYKLLHTIEVYGSLGVIDIEQDVFICVITGRHRVATIRPGETVDRIHAVEFYSLNRSKWDGFGPNHYSQIPGEYDYDADRVTQEGGEFEHPCAPLRKLLAGGSFFFSKDCDLTNRLQNRSFNAPFEIAAADDQFLWNSYMLAPLLPFREHLPPKEKALLDSSQLLTPVIRGHASSTKCRIGLTPGIMTLISRLSCRRAGTRFNARGIDDEGNVANFVETETVLATDEWVFSYAQIRGSVPLFWEQAGLQLPGSSKITITRSPEATQPAFNLHFQTLLEKYGAVHVVNLLSQQGKQGEANLSHEYNAALGDMPSEEHRQAYITNFDFHAVTGGDFRLANNIRPLLMVAAEEFGYYLEDVATKSIVLTQAGVFRTNCLDCLDRTNVIQGIVSQIAIDSFLSHRDQLVGEDFWVVHGGLWADTGDGLSKIYAGTGALKSSFTRTGKMSLGGLMSDVRKSAARLYINNFVDSSRQNTIDLLLGRLANQLAVELYDPISDYVNSQLSTRLDEFSSTEMLQIWVGSYNLNGQPPSESLAPWLFPDGSTIDPDIIAVGFQEMVELTAQQIMSTDPAKRKQWEVEVQKTLNQQRPKGDYILLRSGQLVGTALFLFVKQPKIKYIKRVDGAVKKTGMKGMAGNKGAIAIRLEYGATSICFVTAHLAAGHSNIDQRNLDYHTIDHGLHFTRRRSIKDHDLVFWASDSNYRIALSNEEVRKLVAEENWGKLYENDQLNIGMIAGETFRYYNEGQILFPPTYKFDNGTDTYDTSEKQRVPAWTDRILYRGQGLKELEYNSVGMLRASDHRPVYATFKVEVRIVDEPKREKLAREIYEQRKNMIGDIIGGDLEALSISGGKLPPPSSDKRKWWLDNNASSKVEIPKPPGDGWVLNPKRPKNPFDPTDEPDWIKVNLPEAGTVETIPLSMPVKSIVPPLPPPRRQQSERIPSTPPDPDLSRRSSSASLDGRAKPPVAPKPSFMRARSLVQSPPPTSNSEDEEEEYKPKPPLPPRTQTEPLENGSEKESKVGSIMDDDDTGGKVVGGWIPLQPSKEL